MADIVLTNAFFSINAVDLSAHVRSLTLRYASELQDNTKMSATSRTRIGGLKDWSIDVEFAQDFAASKVDATMFGIVGTSVAIIVRPDAGVVAVTNPQYTGNVQVESYQPIGNATGELAGATITLQGDGALARATS